MKRYFVLLAPLIALCSLMAGGCASMSPATAATLNQDITRDSALISAGTSAATALALQAVPAANRSAATAEVHNIAVAIQGAVNTQNPTVAGFQTLIVQILDQSNSQYANLVGTLLTAGVGEANSYLTTEYSTLSTSQQAQASFALIQALATGVANGSAVSFSTPRHPAAVSAPSATMRQKDRTVDSPLAISACGS